MVQQTVEKNILNPSATMNKNGAKYFIITIDAEDWFQVENFKPWIAYENWDRFELRVERNIHRLLDLFDTVKVTSTNPQAHSRGMVDEFDTGNHDLRPQVSGAVERSGNGNKMRELNGSPPKKICATFFVLCWISDRLPKLVREIADRGHEVASHGCYHNLPTKMPLDSFYSELTDSRKRLEDTIGRPVNGFRAPSFAIDDGILAAIAKAGYRYDSSYNSFHLHGRYGKIALNGHVKIGIARRISEQFYELPISNLAMFGNQLPLGGGAYFRIFPFLLFQIGVKRILRQDNAYLFYIHPWEIDAEQPRVATASWIRKIRHYSNISKTCDRLQKMIRNFNQCNFTSCSQYIDIQTNGLTTSGVR